MILRKTDVVRRGARSCESRSGCITYRGGEDAEVSLGHDGGLLGGEGGGGASAELHLQ